MTIPEVIGFTLGDAARILAGAGVNVVKIWVTAPPKLRHQEYDDSYRVLMLKNIDNCSVELLVCKPL